MAEDTTAPYSVSWNTTTAGQRQPHADRSSPRRRRQHRNLGGGNVTVDNPDTTAPTVSLTGPAEGATVSGTVTLSANASDNVGVAGVQFKVDGS